MLHKMIGTSQRRDRSREGFGLNYAKVFTTAVISVRVTPAEHHGPEKKSNKEGMPV
jgi:hypothetical protein